MASAAIRGRGARPLIAALVLQLGTLGTALAHPAAHPSWQPLPALPVPSEGLTALRLPDGSILALGGDPVMGSRGRLAARFSLAAGAWERLPDAPAPLDTPAALALSMHAVLVVAPSYASGSMALPSRALILDPVWKRWITLPPCPVPLVAPRLIRLDAHVVLAAGGIGDRTGATFDLTTQRWTPVASPVSSLATYTLTGLPGGGALLIAGAAVDAHHRPFEVRRAFILDPRLAWYEAAPPPVAVDNAQVAWLDGRRLLLAGGFPLGDDPQLAAPPALVYDRLANRWAPAGAVGDAHRGAQLVALGPDRAILVGGHGPDGQPNAACLIYDGSRWQATQALPGPWAGYALVSLADGSLVLIGGARPAGASFAPVASTMMLPIGTAQG